jgi:hypothetical protein
MTFVFNDHHGRPSTLPRVDLAGADLTREFGASGTRFPGQGVHIETIRLTGRPLQGRDYFFVCAVMMLLRRACSVVGASLLEYIQSDRRHTQNRNGSIFVIKGGSASPKPDGILNSFKVQITESKAPIFPTW